MVVNRGVLIFLLLLDCPNFLSIIISNNSQIFNIYEAQ